ncbi:hypothetical protein [Thiomonas sp.]|uniref:hypothetical protein n=1 Tax=Thiomonas sp. TaxID=2047785 RepID=UPI0026032E51|nr:hypothetical protein [Thiomonas sp.]
MNTRSANSLSPLFAQSCAGSASIALRRGSWSPDVERATVRQAARPLSVSGQPVREVLRGLLAMLQRARALNSRTL